MLEGFTPWSGLAGGLLIGLSTALLMLLNGRIAGISGIVGGLLVRKAPEVGGAPIFAAGLLLGAVGYVLATGGVFPVRVETSLPIMVAAGLLVGFGISPGLRVHQRPRRQRHRAPVQALRRGDAGVHGNGDPDRVRRRPSVL